MIWVSLALRLVFGGLLAYAGWEKLASYGWWRQTVENMELLPQGLVGPLSGALPGIELVVGLALIAGFWTRPAALGASALFLLFAAAMVIVVASGVPTVCGCFGPGSEYPVSYGHGVRNAAFALIAAGIFFLPESPASVDARVFVRRSTSG